MKEGLTAALLADPGLAALVGARVHWGVLPQGKARAAVVLNVVSTPRIKTMDGRERLVGRLVQADCYADTPFKAEEISRAVIAVADALTEHPFAGADVENVRDGFDAGDAPQGAAANAFHRVSLDLRVWHHDSF